MSDILWERILCDQTSSCSNCNTCTTVLVLWYCTCTGGFVLLVVLSPGLVVDCSAVLFIRSTVYSIHTEVFAVMYYQYQLSGLVVLVELEYCCTRHEQSETSLCDFITSSCRRSPVLLSMTICHNDDDVDESLSGKLFSICVSVCGQI